MVSLYHLFSGTCYSGYDDNEDSFYEIYSDAFEELGECEIDGFEAENGKNEKDCPTTPPPFGTSKSNWDEIGAFYNYWECFITVLGFAWCDKYDPRDARDRRVRRAIEAENAKARKAGKRDYSDQVVHLVHFIKKRDPRVKKHKEDMQKEKKVKEELKKEEEKKQKVLRKEAMERWKVDAAEEEARMILEERVRIRVRLDDLDEEEATSGKGGRRKKKGRKKVSRGEKWRDEDDTAAAPAPVPLASEFSQPSPERKWTRKKVKTRPKKTVGEEGESGGKKDEADQLGIKVWAVDEGEEGAVENVDGGEGVAGGVAGIVEVEGEGRGQEGEATIPLPPPPAASKRPEIDTSYSYIYKEDDVFNIDIINLRKVELDDSEMAGADVDIGADVGDELYRTDEEGGGEGDEKGKGKEGVGEHCEEVEGEAQTVVEDIWRCEMCNKVFKSEGQHTSHMRSKKHREMEKEMERQRKRMERQLKKEQQKKESDTR